MARNKPIGHAEDGMPIWAKNDVGQPVCNRKINNEEAFCQSTILDRETGRCAANGHGGGKRRGGAPVKHGGRSKILRKLGFTKKLNDIEKDPETKSHRQNIELYELAIQIDLEKGLPSPDEWEAAVALYNKAISGEVTALRDLGPILREGLSSAQRLTRVLALADKQRTHKESEAKREAELQSNLNARQANALIAAVIAAIEEEEELTLVIRRRLQTRIARHLNR